MTDHLCENCGKRPGQLVCQDAIPGQKQAYCVPWVFRHYLCRWCRAAWNRTHRRRLTVLDHRPDAEVLARLEAGHVATD